MRLSSTSSAVLALALAAVSAVPSLAGAQVRLIANGTLTGSNAGSYADLSGLNDTLENGVSDHLLGGLGSGIAHLSGDTFVAVPDRGPNAVSYNSSIDDTASYVNRFHTIKMNLQSSTGTGLPFTITPQLLNTTLLFNTAALIYGNGSAYNVPAGAPGINTTTRHYFTGRSDNFDPIRPSSNVRNARLDPEGVRVSPDGTYVYISDEYGPYVYQFLRSTGERVATFQLPANLAVAVPKTTTATEQAANTSGRVPNKGMEGLALLPGGKTLVGIMQAALIQDAALGGQAANLLRIVTIDVASGKATHEYGYLLTTGSGVSEIVALNSHELIVDERDGKGLGDGSKAKYKQFFKIDLNNAVDITSMNGTDAAAVAIPKTLFADLVTILTSNGFTTSTIPAKIEGLAFGDDVTLNNTTLHTLWVANDNDFLQDYAGVTNSNPNQFFVLGFTDADLKGSAYQPE